MCNSLVFEAAQIPAFAVNHDAGAPLLVAFAPRNPKQTAGATPVTDALVLPVLRLCHVSQIGLRIVVTAAIAMVNVSARPFAINSQPCQPMCEVLVTKQSDNAVAVVTDRACLLPN